MAEADAKGRATGAADARAAGLRRRFPTIEDLRARARARVPRFAFDFVDGGANDETCVARNTNALRAVERIGEAQAEARHNLCFLAGVAAA